MYYKPQLLHNDCVVSRQCLCGQQNTTTELCSSQNTRHCILTIMISHVFQLGLDPDWHTSQMLVTADHIGELCDCRTCKGVKKASEPVAELYINQMVSSSLHWQEQGLVINQTATLHGPNSTALTKLAFTASHAATDMLVIKLRIPSWVAEGAAEVCPGLVLTCMKHLL